MNDLVTIKDVAKRAGVSVATVSAVVNKSAFVSEQLKQRVLEAVEEMDYRPNAMARGLKRRKTELLGLIVRDITNPFYPEMMYGAEVAARKAGYSILICTAEDGDEHGMKYIDSMLEHRVDGMLLAIIDKLDSPIFQRFQSNKIPTVLINRAPQDYDGNAVLADNFEAGLIATRHLISLGFDEIAFIGASNNMMTGVKREQGYRQALKEAGLEGPEHLICYADYSTQKAYKEYQKLIAKKQIPRAIYAANDLMAYGAVRALQEAGYRIPQDVAIIGCDDIEFSKNFLIPLSTVHIPKYEVGKIGAEILIRMLNANDQDPPVKELIELKPHLVVRNSCGAKIDCKFKSPQ